MPINRFSNSICAERKRERERRRKGKDRAQREYAPRALNVNRVGTSDWELTRRTNERAAESFVVPTTGRGRLARTRARALGGSWTIGFDR